MSGYIGTQPVPQATQTRDAFTATSGQTSFATSGYTPNFLDVFLNGVKLAAADYTASNGSDVVLATGATTGDILEVVAYTTFEISGVAGLTPSIDDNGNATAITIDSSENVLVGKTSAGAASTGFESRSSGYTAITRDGGQPLEVRRLTSDGVLIDLRKDSATVGSIGTKSGSLLIGSTDTFLRVNDPSDTIFPSDSAGLERDNAINLGKGSSRFKDLYLSGGVYLGGTGSANKLDDYEEGTWTPTFTPDTSGSLPLQSVYDTMQYVKIGNWVTLSGFIRAATPSSPVGSSPTVGNFPFTVANLADSAGRSSGSVSYFDDSAGNWSVLPCYIVESQTQAYVKIDSSTIGANDGFYISLNYRTT